MRWVYVLGNISGIMMGIGYAHHDNRLMYGGAFIYLIGFLIGGAIEGGRPHA